MTDVSGNTTSQYAVVAPISVSTDISPSRQTRESSNKFLQEHTIISELKKKDRNPAGRLKYVDVEFTNSNTLERSETSKREGPIVVNVNTNYEDWTVPRPRPRKQPPPPPPPNAKPKPITKAKSIAQMVVPVDTAVAGETVKTKARCASETDTVDDERIQHQPQQPVNLKRPSRKAPPPPKQVQRDKDGVTQITCKSKSPRPLQGSIGSDKDVVVLAPHSPKQRRALSSEKEIEVTDSCPVEGYRVTDSCPVEGYRVKRTSSFKEVKVFRPVRKAPPPPPPNNYKSSEYINVAKDEDNVTFSTFFVSHKKAQSLSYDNVVCAESDASMLGTFPLAHQSYENVERPRKVHRSDEQRRGLSQSYENVLNTRQAIESKLNKVSFQSNNADLNKVDTDSHSGTAVKQQQQESPKSNGAAHYKPGVKKKSIKKRRNISPPHSPPPPPPPPLPLETTGGLPMSPKASSEITTASPPLSSKLKKLMAPPPPPLGTARRPGTPPPRPPPPDESPPSSIPPPPDEIKPVNGEVPPRPPPPLDEPQPTRRLMSKKQQNMINIVHSVEENSVAPSEPAPLNTALLSPPLIMAKKPLTSPPAAPPPPPPPPSSALPTPRTPSGQKCVSFEIQGGDVESDDTASPSISTSSSEASLHQEQIIRQQCNGDVDDDLHAEIITNYTTPPDFFGQPSRELDSITEYADTESSGSLYIARTVSEGPLDENSDQQISSDNSPDLKRLDGNSTLEGSRSKVPLQKVWSPLVETNTLVNGGYPEIGSSNDQDMVEQHGPNDGGPSSRERKETGANPFWYRESMMIAVGRGNALHGYPSKKRPLPPPRSQSVDPLMIEKMESSPSRIRRPPEGTKDEENSENFEVNLAYMESSNGSSASGSCPIPLPRTKHSIKVPPVTPPVAPPRDKSSLSSSPARKIEKSKAAFTRVRAASFLTVSAGKELNTVTTMYMGSKQVDQFVGKINNIARDLSDKAASPMIMYIATEKIRLAAPDSNVLFQSFAVENILATTLCPINKRIVGMLVWKSRALPSWHLIRCTDNLVAGSVLESIQMACETVKSDEITEVRPLSQASILSSGSSEGMPDLQKVADLFRKFPAIFISDVKVGSAISVNEIIGNVLHTLLPSNSIEVQLWLSIYQVRLINLSTGLLFAQYDMSDIKLFGTLARDKRYLGIVVGNTEKKQPVVCAILRCKTLSHVVMILSYLREACQVSFHENSENPSAALWSRGDDDPEEPAIKSEDDNDEEDEQFALEVLKSFSGPSKSNTVPSPVASRKTLKERLKTLKGTLTGSFDKTPSSPISIPAESSFKSHIQAGGESTSPLASPSNRKSYLGLLSNPEEYAKFTMCYIGSATLEGVVTGSTVYDALQAIEEGGVAAGAALVPKNQISFVASAMGITLVDPTQKMFITRHYPKNQIEAFLRGPDKSNILGFVTKMTGFGDKIKCHLLKEVTEPLKQIYSAVEYWLKLDNETLV